jgi:coenzyme F420 hydrogenase subunit beta
MDRSSIHKNGLLTHQVIQQGLCVSCGACVDFCPYFQYIDGKVVVLDRCEAETRRCENVCPRTDLWDDSLERLKRNRKASYPLGPTKKVVLACSLDPDILASAQYGGVVSSLLALALKENLVDSAVVVNKGNGRSPSGKLIQTQSEILSSAGSRYTASASLSIINRVENKEKGTLAVVGLPCQIEALARMEQLPVQEGGLAERIGLKIGLFCTWALDYRGFMGYLKQKGVLQEIQKYDIPPPPAAVIRVLINQDWQEFPLEEIRPFIQKGCSLCQDMTAEFADISVGMVEGVEKMNTVIIRNDIGTRIIDHAINENIIKVSEIRESQTKHLEFAAGKKREQGRAIKEEMKRNS